MKRAKIKFLLKLIMWVIVLFTPVYIIFSSETFWHKMIGVATSIYVFYLFGLFKVLSSDKKVQNLKEQVIAKTEDKTNTVKITESK